MAASKLLPSVGLRISKATRRPRSSARKVTLRFMLLALALMLVPSCAGIGSSAGIDRCAGWKPIYGQPHDVDVMSDELFLAIKAHNKHYSEVCGAKP